jgi:hypothetical protein
MKDEWDEWEEYCLNNPIDDRQQPDDRNPPDDRTPPSTPRCPKCNSSRISKDGDWNNDGEKINEWWDCDNCGERWTWAQDP